MAFYRRSREDVPFEDQTPPFYEDGVLVLALAIVFLVVIGFGILYVNSFSDPSLAPKIESPMVPVPRS